MGEPDQEELKGCTELAESDAKRNRDSALETMRTARKLLAKWTKPIYGEEEGTVTCFLFLAFDLYFL